MNNDLILGELKKMNTLLALLVTKGNSQSEKIEMLSRVGFTPKEIADYIGTTSNTVSVALNAMKKKVKKKK
jgi:hypothetical protein